VSLVGAVDDYFATLDETTRRVFERVRTLALEVAPDAGQGKSYGMAALRARGRPLLGFRAAKGHLSVFPFSPEVVEAVAPRLTGFELSKGTIRFTADRPLPDDVVRDVVRLRLEQVSGGAG
jgi:uncharacterized protein YdhG (YjbR/CyaY superfamily)